MLQTLENGRTIGVLSEMGIKEGLNKRVFIQDILKLFDTSDIDKEYNLVGGSVQTALGEVKIPTVGDFLLNYTYDRHFNSNTLHITNHKIGFELNIELIKIENIDKYDHECYIHVSNGGWIDIVINSTLFTREIKNEYEFKIAHERDKEKLIYREKQKIHLIFSPKHY